MSTVPSIPSGDYPKWLYKAGARDLMVKSLAEEEAQRGTGYSHEIPAEKPSAPVASASPALDRPDMVMRDIMDSALKEQENRFNRAWEKKCDAYETLDEARRNLAAEHDKTVVALKQLGDEHAALVAEHAVLKAEKSASVELNKPGPVKAPVAAQKG